MTEDLTLNAVKRELTSKFRTAGLDTPDLDARLLIMAATGLSHVDLIAQGNTPRPSDSTQLLADYTNRRLAGEPIDHILGYREFYGRRFKVTKDVLSPRPETELLVKAALDIIKNMKTPRILDLGTGTGAIVISVLAEHTNAKGVAVDVSEAALKTARQNAKKHQVLNRLTLLQGNWFEPIAGKYDLILSNPPYITDVAMKELDTDVADYDPDLALRGGADGLGAYRAILAKAPAYLKPKGHLIFEIGYDQGEAVSALVQAAGFRNITLTQDLAGHDRVIKAVI